MGKRKKGKGKGRKRQSAITRRDPGAKRSSGGAAEDGAPEDGDAEGGDAEDGELEADEGAADDRDSSDDSAAGGAGVSDDEADDAATEGELATAARDALDEEEHDDDRVGFPDGADWALPLVKLEHGWTWLETRMLFACLLSLTLVLCMWIGIRGMKEPLEAQIPAGTVFRALAGALILGAIARAATRGRLDLRKRNLITGAAILVGILTAKLWRGVGIAYFEGVLDWLQEGSVLTLFGGLNGISTRLTMLVALIGGSLAAASGTHISIDVVIRILPQRTRKPVTILGILATVAVCFAASWGTMDHLAITEFGAKIDAPASEKIGVVVDQLGDQAFVWRKQIGLDLSALPNVIQGVRWNDESRMTGRQWNAFLDEGGFNERFGAEKMANLRAPDTDLDASWQPFVIIPDHDTRGMLKHGMDLLWPVGFLMIGLRFLLRGLLLLVGHVRPRAESSDDEDDEAATKAATKAEPTEAVPTEEGA